MSMLAFRNALVAIYNADTAVRALTGRTTMNLVPRGAHVYEQNLPVLTYFVVTSPQKAGTKGTRVVQVQLEAWAKDDVAGVFTTLEGLMDRAEALFIGDNFVAQGIKVWRRRIASREDDGPEEGVRWIRTVMTFEVTTA
jgi:hypothetical protein